MLDNDLLAFVIKIHTILQNNEKNEGRKVHCILTKDCFQRGYKSLSIEIRVME